MSQSQHFERALDRVHEPRVRDPRLGVDPKLPAAVDTLSGRREDFANPIGSEGEEGHVLHHRHAHTPPTSQVGHDHVFAEMKLGLVEDPPASGPLLPLVERCKRGSEAGGGNRVPRRRPWAQEKLAVQDVGHFVLRGAQPLEDTRPQTLERVHHQARIQVEGEHKQRTLYELIDPSRLRDGNVAAYNAQVFEKAA